MRSQLLRHNSRDFYEEANHLWHSFNNDVYSGELFKMFAQFLVYKSQNINVRPEEVKKIIDTSLNSVSNEPL